MPNVPDAWAGRLKVERLGLPALSDSQVAMASSLNVRKSQHPVMRGKYRGMVNFHRAFSSRPLR